MACRRSGAPSSWKSIPASSSRVQTPPEVIFIHVSVQPPCRDPTEPPSTSLEVEITDLSTDVGSEPHNRCWSGRESRGKNDLESSILGGPKVKHPFKLLRRASEASSHCSALLRLIANGIVIREPIGSAFEKASSSSINGKLLAGPWPSTSHISIRFLVTYYVLFLSPLMITYLVNFSFWVILGIQVDHTPLSNYEWELGILREKYQSCFREMKAKNPALDRATT